MISFITLFFLFLIIWFIYDLLSFYPSFYYLKINTDKFILFCCNLKWSCALISGKVGGGGGAQVVAQVALEGGWEGSHPKFKFQTKFVLYVKQMVATPWVCNYIPKQLFFYVKINHLKSKFTHYVHVWFNLSRKKNSSSKRNLKKTIISPKNNHKLSIYFE